MKRVLLTGWLMAAGFAVGHGAVAADPQPIDPDPMKSQACATARDELDDLLKDASLPRPRVPTERIEMARRRAALACLGGKAGVRERSIAAQPAQAVPGPTITSAAPQTPSLPAVAPPAPPLAIPRPSSITSCDAAGCWDSEGRRLNSVGPLLVGPRGPCLVQGALVNCP